MRPAQTPSKVKGSISRWVVFIVISASYNEIWLSLSSFTSCSKRKKKCLTEVVAVGKLSANLPRVDQAKLAKR